MKAIELYVCDFLCIISRFVYITILCDNSRDLNLLPFISLGSFVRISSIPSEPPKRSSKNGGKPRRNQSTNSQGSEGDDKRSHTRRGGNENAVTYHY